MARVAVEQPSLEEVAEAVLAEFRQAFPEAEYRFNGEVYGEEDLDIDIYVAAEKMISLDRFANEITFRYWQETGYNILPMIAPMASTPSEDEPMLK